MTIYSDNIGNKFLGDCIYANHNISYPNTKFLQAYPNSDISAGLTSLMNSSGLLYRSIPSQLLFNTDSSLFFLHFGVNGDIDDRVTFTNSGGSSDSDLVHASIYNDSGASTNETSNPFSSSNTNRIAKILYIPSGTGIPRVFDPNDLTNSNRYLYWTGVADQNSVALFVQYIALDLAITNSFFWYGGTVTDVNTSYNYYTGESYRQYFVLHGCDIEGSLPPLASRHSIDGTIGLGNSLLTTGDAQYPIVCSDGQTPTSQWATDFYVFDDNATLGYPAIGKVRNLLLATGTYTIGKPVKLQGTVVPDNGFNRWLPVGTFAGKTVLMRCYSSVV